MLKIRRLFISLGFALSPSILFAGGMPTTETSSSDTSSSVTQTSNVSDETSNTVSGTSENNNSNTQNSENASSNSSTDDSQTSSNSFIAIEDEPLIIDVSGISDSDGVGKIYVQWQKETSDG